MLVVLLKRFDFVIILFFDMFQEEKQPLLCEFGLWQNDNKSKTLKFQLVSPQVNTGWKNEVFSMETELIQVLGLFFTIPRLVEYPPISLSDFFKPGLKRFEVVEQCSIEQRGLNKILQSVTAFFKELFDEPRRISHLSKIYLCLTFLFSVMSEHPQKDYIGINIPTICSFFLPLALLRDYWTEGHPIENSLVCPGCGTHIWDCKNDSTDTCEFANFHILPKSFDDSMNTVNSRMLDKTVHDIKMNNFSDYIKDETISKSEDNSNLIEMNSTEREMKCIIFCGINTRGEESCESVQVEKIEKTFKDRKFVKYKTPRNDEEMKIAYLAGLLHIVQGGKAFARISKREEFLLEYARQCFRTRMAEPRLFEESYHNWSFFTFDFGGIVEWVSELLRQNRRVQYWKVATVAPFVKLMLWRGILLDGEERIELLKEEGVDVFKSPFFKCFQQLCEDINSITRNGYSGSLKVYRWAIPDCVMKPLFLEFLSSVTRAFKGGVFMVTGIGCNCFFVSSKSRSGVEDCMQDLVMLGFRMYLYKRFLKRRPRLKKRIDKAFADEQVCRTELGFKICKVVLGVTVVSAVTGGVWCWMMKCKK